MSRFRQYISRRVIFAGIIALLAVVVLSGIIPLKASAGGGGTTLFLRSESSYNPWLSFVEGENQRGAVIWDSGTTLTFKASGLNGGYDSYLSIDPRILVDTLGPVSGNVVKVTITFDFDGNDTTDASMSLDAFDIDSEQGFQQVRSEWFRQSFWNGEEMHNMRNGIITVQVWAPVFNSPVIVRTDAAGSFVVLPYTLESYVTPTATATSTNSPTATPSSTPTRTPTGTPTPMATLNPNVTPTGSIELLTPVVESTVSRADYTCCSNQILGKGITFINHGAEAYQLRFDSDPRGYGWYIPNDSFKSSSQRMEVQSYVSPDMPDGTYFAAGVLRYRSNSLWYDGQRFSMTITLVSPTQIATSTATRTPTVNVPGTATALALQWTPTETPTQTPSNTPSSTATDTPTGVPTATLTNTATNTPTSTPSPTVTNTPSSTSTSSPTAVVARIDSVSRFTNSNGDWLIRLVGSNLAGTNAYAYVSDQYGGGQLVRPADASVWTATKVEFLYPSRVYGNVYVSVNGKVSNLLPINPGPTSTPTVPTSPTATPTATVTPTPTPSGGIRVTATNLGVVILNRADAQSGYVYGGKVAVLNEGAVAYQIRYEPAVNGYGFDMPYYYGFLNSTARVETGLYIKSSKPDGDYPGTAVFQYQTTYGGVWYDGPRVKFTIRLVSPTPTPTATATKTPTPRPTQTPTRTATPKAQSGKVSAPINR